MTLAFAALRAANATRSQRWFTGDVHEWMTETWITALGGEIGEALNITKKLIRDRDRMAGNSLHRPQLLERLGAELADVLIYLDETLAAEGFEAGLDQIVPFDDFGRFRHFNRLAREDQHQVRPLECWSSDVLRAAGRFADMAADRNKAGERRCGLALVEAIDSLAIAAGEIDLGQAVTATFNQKSADLGYPERLG